MKTVIFDFDGTLADTYPIVVKILNRIGYMYGLPKIDPESNEYRGAGLRELVRRFNMPKWKLLLLAFHTKFLMRRYLTQMKLFPGILDLLVELQTMGYDLWIFSSNSRNNIRNVLKNNGCSVKLGIVSELSLVNKGKGLKKLLKNIGIDPQNAVYVGDEVRDFEGAVLAGIPFLGVGWGYNTADALKKAGVKLVANSIEWLGAVIAK
jgi:phosphoglycolate phosphatase-like HAD superfamily hydrolase